MNMTNRHHRNVYSEMPDKQKKIVDDIFKVVWDHCKENNIKLMGDDRAEDFVGAITKYMMESKEVS